MSMASGNCSWLSVRVNVNMKSSDAKASKCHLKFSDDFYQTCIFKFSNFT